MKLMNFASCTIISSTTCAQIGVLFFSIFVENTVYLYSSIEAVPKIVESESFNRMANFTK